MENDIKLLFHFLNLFDKFLYPSKEKKRAQNFGFF